MHTPSICRVEQDTRAHLAQLDAQDAADEAAELFMTDATDRILMDDGELLLWMADDEADRPRVPYHRAWAGLRLRDDLTAGEILEAVLMAPSGAQVSGALHTMLERLRAVVNRKCPHSVTALARSMARAHRNEVAA